MKRKYLLVICSLTIWILTGCSKDRTASVKPGRPEIADLVVSLRLDQTSLRNSFTRQPSATQTAQDKECEINTLTLFITYDDAGHEITESSQTLVKPDISSVLKFKLPVEMNGLKHFYLVANMPREQMSSFRGLETVFTVPAPSTARDYSNASYVMDIDRVNGQGSNIMMSSVILLNGSRDISVSGENLSIQDPVSLTRLVSKVLLTCAEEPGAPGYVKIAENIGGWVSFRNMRYMLNTFDRKFYLFPHDDAGTGLTGPVENMSDVNYKVSAFVDNNYELKDKKVYADNFLNFPVDAVMDKLDNDHIEKFYQALPYDADRHYTEGLYCLENRVKEDMDFARGTEKFFLMTRQLTTYLIAAARYTPEKIFRKSKTGESAMLEQYTALREEDMIAELTGQTEVIGNHVRVYAPGTFWYYKNQYFTLDGVRLYLETNNDIDPSRIKCYEGGWGYYTTFIDGSPNPDTGIVDYANDKTWGLCRNDYYILKLRKLVPPGAPTPGVKIMLFPVLEHWKNTDVDLEMDETVG